MIIDTTNLPISLELLKEWDEKLDTMEMLFDASVMLDQPCQKQLATVRRLRRQLRDLCPISNVPIVIDPEEIP